MRPPILAAALLSALLAACSESDDLGASFAGGPLQGQLLAEGHGCDEEHEHEGEDCDEHDEHEDEHVVPAAEPASPVEPALLASPASPAASPAASPVASPPAEPVAPAADVAEPAPASPATAESGLAQRAADAAAAAAEQRASSSRAGRFDPKAYKWIDFDPLIDFDYPELVRVDGPPPPELPEDVRALHGKQIAIEGFMNPLAFDSGGVKEFSLVKDPSFCCFGQIPQMNHWIHVTLPDKERTEFYSFDPVAVYGTLEVGEQYEDGYVISLYRLRAERVEGDF